MLKELIDIALLEDLVRGLAQASRLRVCVFDARGILITASTATHPYSLIGRFVPRSIPANLTMVPVPAHDPPAVIAFVETGGAWYVAAPIYLEDQTVGFVAVGEFRTDAPPASTSDSAAAARVESAALHHAWESLPKLDRGGSSHPASTARWGARLISEWCRRETRLAAADRQVALVGDIAELLTGESQLQTTLDRIVAETARAMQCRFASLRLYDPASDELHVKAVYGLSKGYLEKGAVRRSENAIDSEALRGEIVYVENAVDDPRVQYKEEARREGIVSILTAPMMYRGKPIGVVRVYTDRKQRFRRSQRNLLAAVADQAAIAVVQAQLVSQRLKSEETERQLRLAGEVQARMVRSPGELHPELETAMIFQPSFTVGGDFCDFVTLADGRLACAVADVAGKGIPASLLMASVRGSLRATAESSSDLGEIMTRLNRHVCRETTPAEFVTALIVAVDLSGRRLSYCNAGHEPLLRIRRAKFETSEVGELVLGISAAERYYEHQADIEPGDALLMYTDGAVEAMNFAGQLFGRERLWKSFEQYADRSPEQMLRNILWDIRRFVGLAEQSDDLTMVGMRVRK